MTTVVNVRFHKCDVYIGRGSRWGNPFKIGPDDSRDVVIEKYGDYIIACLENSPALVVAFDKLKGKRLGCYCKPLKCHGDILVELIEGTNGN